MITVWCDLESEKLYIKVQGTHFQDWIEIIRSMKKCYFDSDKKAYYTDIVEFRNIEEEVLYHISLDFPDDSLEVSELTRKQVDYFYESLKELKASSSRRLVKWDLLKKPPLKGIGANEKYQSIDLLRAINQNRFLFNWEMGLGKSYALAALIENLRYYDLIDKCIIMSTSIGIYNLKDELLKFGNNLKESEIYVINLLSEQDFEDRDIFNTQKYPYKIFIMTYDTFTGINNYYYDVANAPKNAASQILQLETELKDLTAQKKSSFKAEFQDKLEKGEFNTKLKDTLKNDKDIVKLKTKISALKDKLHPSRKVTYKKSYLPLQQWAGGHGVGLFLDESHSIAIPKSLRAKHIKNNLCNFDYRYEFTGTFADKYEKMYMQLLVLDRSLVNGKNYNSWLEEYCEVGNKFSRYAVNNDGWKMDKIADLNKLLLSKYASKRVMKECLDLPSNYDVPTIYIDMSPKQREIYEAFVKAELSFSREREKVHNETQKDIILNMFQIFQMSVDNPSIISKSRSFVKLPADLQEKIVNFDYENESTKISVLDDILSERVDEYGERGIVWYYHPDTKDQIVNHLKKYNPIVVEAGMSNEELNSKIKDFKTDPSHKIIIGSIIIMNTSVTLTECAFNIYLERTYNYTMYSQSKGRIFRPGQDKITRNYTMSYKDSIDNLQLKNLETKGATINNLLNKDFISQGLWKKIFNYNNSFELEN